MTRPTSAAALDARSGAARRSTGVAAAPAACAHCGLAVPEGFVDEERAEQFCCAGCRTAFTIIRDHGLDQYYGFGERKTAPVRSTGRSYEEFDHEAFHALHVSRTSEGLSRTELFLEGVHCASCVWLVERVPLLLRGVARAELNVGRSLAAIEWDAGQVQLSAVARTLESLGYAPHPYLGIRRDEVRRREDRAALVRIGAAGAIAINVMLAAVAMYSGVLSNGIEGEFERFFRWVSLALTVPAILGPGRVFFSGAWAALRTRTLHLDLPIAIALAAGTARGTVNTITDQGPVYFDGVTILIFLLLVGRYLQQRGTRAATDASELLSSITPRGARVVDDRGAVRELPAAALLPGMLLDVRAGDTIAADGIVEGGRSAVNVSLLTGESRPVAADVGSQVFAGTLNVSAPLRVRVERAGEESRVARLLRQVEESTRRRAPVVVLANRLAGWFVAIVLVLATATWLVGIGGDSSAALDHAIALLVVTCPCALAMATPLAVTVATGRAARRGVFIKGGDAIEALARPSTLLLDKTGTVTEGRLSLVRWDGPDWVKPLVVALERESTHPLADGLRLGLTDDAAPVETSPVESSEHVTGAGIRGTVAGRHVVVGSPSFVGRQASAPVPDEWLAAGEGILATATPVWISVDGVAVARAWLGDPIRPDAAASIRALRDAGWDVRLLSGDATPVVRAVGSMLGLPPDACRGEASPEDKLHEVETLRRTGRVVMVGDGVNDAAAIAAATVGIGVHGGAEASLATADIYLTTPGLSPLVELARGAGNTMRVIRRNIAFSLLYNVAGAALALTGTISPLIAAVLMPISSLTVVLGSWYGHSFPRQAARSA
jgi:P-type Cu2+ transporter